jgi:hypothetical protein
VTLARGFLRFHARAAARPTTPGAHDEQIGPFHAPGWYPPPAAEDPMARKDPVSHLARFPHGAPERLVDEILALGEAAIPLLEQAIDAQGPAAAPALVVYARLAGGPGAAQVDPGDRDGDR